MAIDLADIRRAFAADPGPAACDTETTSMNDLWRGLEIRGVSLALGQRTWYLPLSHPHSENLRFSAVRDLLLDLHRDRPGRLWCWFNAKYDWSVLRSTMALRPEAVPNQWDTSIGAWLEDENIQIRDLKGRCAALFGPDARAPQEHMRRLCAGPTLTELEDEHYYGPAGRVEGGPRQPMGITRAVAHERALVDPRYGRREMWDLTAAEMDPYARSDAALTLDLYRYQSSLDHRHPIGVAMGREMAVARVLTDMERTGIRVDAGRAEAAHARALARLAELDAVFDGVNPSSHDQLVDLVHTRWGFPVLHRSPKTNSPTLDRDTLELLGDDPRIVGLLEWRRLQKAVTAYYRPLLDAVDGTDRIHATFNQARVKTGRFSSERPNLFTIPRAETIDEIRGIFVPAPGYELWEYDLGQAEVRAAASMAGDSALLAALNDPGRDVYAEVAATMGIKRQTAKTVVLADGYGAGALGLAAQLLKGTGRMLTPQDVARADQLQRHLARSYPLLERAARRSEAVARSEGRIPLPPPGRWRHFRGQGYAPEEYRKAWNSRCQGGIAELAKSALVAMHSPLADLGARPVLHIYDSFVVEVPPGLGPVVGKLIGSVIDDVSYFRNVRLPVEAKRWSTVPPSAPSSPASGGTVSVSPGPGSPPAGSPRSTPTAPGSSPATGPDSPTTATSPPSTGAPSSGSTASPGDSPASPSVSPAASSGSTIRAGSGPPSAVLFGSFGPGGWSSRTSANFSRLPAAQRRRLSSGIFPPSGMTRAGLCFRLAPLVPHTHGKECSSWPTPSARDWKSSASNLLGTNARPLNEVASNGKGSCLNPAFVEWLLGFPIGWTECGPSETASPLPSPRLSDAGSSTENGHGPS